MRIAFAIAVSAASTVGLAAVASQANATPQGSEVRIFAQNATIVDVASGSDRFTTLVQALEAAGLADTLSSEGPFTVFAPTDEAFADLPPGTLEALLQPENQDLLVEILRYHVVSGEVTSSELQTGTVPALNGSLAVTAEGGSVTVNNADVIAADVEASNGIVHAIDEVLIPPDVASELAARLQNTPTVEGADIQTEPGVESEAEVPTEQGVEIDPVEPAAEPTAEPVPGLW